MTNTERARAILSQLEANGWAITAVDNDGAPDEIIYITGETASERVELALIEVESVDESAVWVESGLERSHISLILSNHEEMLSDYGSRLGAVFDQRLRLPAW